jgi:hypothetical protein
MVVDVYLEYSIVCWLLSRARLLHSKVVITRGVLSDDPCSFQPPQSDAAVRCLSALQDKTGDIVRHPGACPYVRS